MSSYYYVDGHRVELQNDDEHVAIERSAVPTALLSKFIGETKATQRLGTFVVPRASIAADGLSELGKAGALRPVFRLDRAMLVPLAEVRVEMDNQRQRDAVKRLLSTTDLGVVIAEETDDRLVLKPASGDPVDALRAANEIYEEARPAASSVRFLQFVPKPGF